MNAHQRRTARRFRSRFASAAAAIAEQARRTAEAMEAVAMQARRTGDVLIAMQYELLSLRRKAR